MKKYCWILFCILSYSLSAQEKLVIMGKVPNLYVSHSITGGETLQSISNAYGQSVARIASFNARKANATLGIGEKLKIPLTEYNILRIKGSDNNAPLYHIIKKGDNLYKISKAYKIPIARLREWNGLRTDIVKNGQNLVVGYMVNAKIVPSKKTEPDDKPVKDVNATEYTPAKPEPSSGLPVKKETVPAVSVTPVLINEKTAERTTGNPPVTSYIPRDNDEGFFALLYSQEGKGKAMQFRSGDVATFKTISGWTDHKYYVLVNDIAPETLVRVTGPGNKSICAKVLGPLQETKGGEGLLLRMSNSAASVLGITDQRVTVTITYFE